MGMEAKIDNKVGKRAKGGDGEVRVRGEEEGEVIGRAATNPLLHSIWRRWVEVCCVVGVIYVFIV